MSDLTLDLSPVCPLLLCSLLFPLLCEVGSLANWPTIPPPGGRSMWLTGVIISVMAASSGGEASCLPRCWESLQEGSKEVGGCFLSNLPLVFSDGVRVWVLRWVYRDTSSATVSPAWLWAYCAHSPSSEVVLALRNAAFPLNFSHFRSPPSFLLSPPFLSFSLLAHPCNHGGVISTVS